MRSDYRAQCYRNIGINSTDRVAVILPFGPWVAGPSVQEAFLRVGCKVFALGPVDSIEQVKVMVPILKEHNINIVATAPSYIQKILFFLHELGEKIELDKVITSGEYVSEKIRKLVFEKTGAELFSSYAASEGFIGIECSKHKHFHFDPKKIRIDVVDKDTLEPTSSVGILLITIYDSEAIPVVRYMIGDMGRIESSPCLCGSLLPRINLCGRMKETFCLAGAVNINPFQLRETFSKLSFSIDYCKIELDSSESEQDIIRFYIYSLDKRVLEENNKCREEFIDILPHASIDLSDVLHHGLVCLEVNIEYVSKSSKNAKMKVDIIDNRKYVR